MLRAENPTNFMFWNLGASTSWNPLDLSRHVMGLLYPVHSIVTINGFYQQACVTSKGDWKASGTWHGSVIKHDKSRVNHARGFSKKLTFCVKGPKSAKWRYALRLTHSRERGSFNVWKTKNNLLYIYGISPYRAVNTFHHGYKNLICCICKESVRTAL